MNKILLVEDEPNLRDALTYLLNKEEYQVDISTNGQDALDQLKSKTFDLVICDIKLPGKDGFELLQFRQTQNLDTDFIMITAYGSVESAINAIKLGAEEYLTKPFLNDDFLRVVKKVLNYRELKKEHASLQKELRSKYSLGQSIIGKSAVMQDVFEVIERVSKYDPPVLITGESGTGKELISRAIHFQSKRKGKPFVAINCGAIPEALMESEFFGHVKGAFTGSTQAKKGLIEHAEGGTVFLDEIGEMSLGLQVKLLRLLQNKEIRRVGDVSTRKVDVRIITATNKNLKECIKKGTFRDDLYYRLNVIEIKLPSLKERREDIPLLVHHFIEHYNKAFSRTIEGISEEALDQLLSYDWPGNIRELEHVIQRSIILCRNESIDLMDLDDKFSGPVKRMSITIPDEYYNLKNTFIEAKNIIEKELINKALLKKHNNRTQAAKLLGISHRALMYKLSEKKN